MSVLSHRLIECNLLQVSTRIHAHRGAVARRCIHAASVAFQTLQKTQHDHVVDATDGHDLDAARGRNVGVVDNSFYAKRDMNRMSFDNEPRTGLQKKVEDLKDILAITAEGDTKRIDSQSTLSEDDLLEIYRNLLNSLPTVPADIPSIKEPDIRADQELISSLAKRFLHPSQPSTVSELRDEAADTDIRSEHKDSSFEPSLMPAEFSHPLKLKPYHLAVSHLIESLGDLKPGEPAIESLTSREWSSLIRVCVYEMDGDSAEKVLSLMKAYNVPSEELTEEMIRVLKLYAYSGNVEKTEFFMSKFIPDSPTETQRHLHVKAYLTATPPKSIPEKALSVLHDYENRNLAPPMKTYSSVIYSLFSVPSNIAKAHAWDLFSHMRYVAHPQPDAFLYSIMIRACAFSPPSGGGSSEPERALDLWTEMTVDKRIPPTRSAYVAVIQACSASGDPKFVNEAFRLAREMLDGYRDATGQPLFKPNGTLFRALLDGAKRTGQLSRVRWILAEMIKAIVSQGQEDEFVADEIQLDERVMIHVFHAYATYRITFLRNQTVVVEDQKTESSKSEKKSSTDLKEPISSAGPLFSSIPPQDHHRILEEAKSLFQGILHDNAIEDSSSDADGIPRIFKNVKITTPLLNAYVSVFYRHARFTEGEILYRTIFKEHGLKKNIYTYVAALEMCGRTSKYARPLAAQFAQQVFNDFERWFEARKAAGVDEPSPRLIERVYSSAIRAVSVNNDLDTALRYLKQFAGRYPPKALTELSTNKKPAMRSTRTVLDPKASPATAFSPRPLVRLTSAPEVADDTVPPFFVFSDLELLHQRVIAAHRVGDISYLTWLCMAYRANLRRRRDLMLRQDVELNSGGLDCENDAHALTQHLTTGEVSQSDNMSIEN